MESQTNIAHEGRRGGPSYATWGYLMLGLMGLVAAFTVVRPRPSIDSGPPTPVESAKLIDAAVADAGKNEGGNSATEQEYLAAQRKQLAAKKDAEELTAKLDQLARDPKALEQHNRDVANKVQLVAKGNEATVATTVRSNIEAALSEAVQDEPGSKESFVAAIQPEVATRQAEMRTIVVAAGDTLSVIAHRAYGDMQMYRRIFEANPRLLTSPNHIYPGQVLRIPAR